MLNSKVGVSNKFSFYTDLDQAFSFFIPVLPKSIHRIRILIEHCHLVAKLPTSPLLTFLSPPQSQRPLSFNNSTKTLTGFGPGSTTERFLRGLDKKVSSTILQ